MNRQLLFQRAVIVLVMALVLAIGIALIAQANTSPTIKVIVIGVIAGLIAGGLYTAARGGEK